MNKSCTFVAALSRTVAHILKTDTDPDAVPMNESTPPQFTDTLASRLGPSPASTPPRIGILCYCLTFKLE